MAVRFSGFLFLREVLLRSFGGTVGVELDFRLRVLLRLSFECGPVGFDIN